MLQVSQQHRCPRCRQAERFLKRSIRLTNFAHGASRKCHRVIVLLRKHDVTDKMRSRLTEQGAANVVVHMQMVDKLQQSPTGKTSLVQALKPLDGTVNR